MEFNRNHYFMLGVVILGLGFQFRTVDAYVLTDDASEFVAKQWQQAEVEEKRAPKAFITAAAAPAPVVARRTLKPPPWLGWAAISLGAVLALHSLAMPRPG